MNDTVFLTCCSLNHFAAARTLGESLRAAHPAVPFVIGLVDRLPPDGLPGAGVEFEAIPADRSVAPRLDDMAARYDVGALNCALKTAFAGHLFRTRGDLRRLVYLDADVRVYAPLDDALALLDRRPIVFSPHRLRPASGPGGVSEETFLRTGSYNAGFFGLARSPGAARFLDWMTERMRNQAAVAPLRGLYVDQKWFDLAAALFHSDVGLLTHPGCNVGYWNLEERRLGRTPDGRVQTGEGRPLVFFHFSGFDPRRPDRLSAYSDLDPREAGAPLADLARDYRERLAAFEGARWAAVPCAFEEVGRRGRRESFRRLSLAGKIRHVARRTCRWAGWRLLLWDHRGGTAGPP